jgi:Flp pilus assembly protein TadG
MIARNRIKNEQGQTMTEFAIVLPVLVLIVFAVIQFGITFNNYLALTDAARAGARKAAVSRLSGDGDGQAVSAVRASAANLNQSDLDVSVASSWQQGTNVTVTATYPYSISLLGLVVKSGRLSTTVTERVE